MNKRFWLTAVLISTALTTSLADAVAQQVLQRARLGNQSGNIALITQGAFAGKLAVLDGDEVYAVAVSGAFPVPCSSSSSTGTRSTSDVDL